MKKKVYTSNQATRVASPDVYGIKRISDSDGLQNI